MTEQYLKFVKKSLWVTVIVFVVRCALSWKEITQGISTYSIYGLAGEAISLSVIIMIIYERWLWRLDPTRGIPALKKEYTGVIKSLYDHKERIATLKVKQTFLSLRIIMTTEESRSESIAASLPLVNGEQKMSYTYVNVPKNAFRYRSEIHYGTALLNIDSIEEFEGSYFTDRKTSGDMKFSFKKQPEKSESKVALK